MSFGKNDITGAVSGFSNILVWDAQGRLKVIGGGTPPPPAPVVWGTITGLVTNQTDLINYLDLNFYPLSSNPAGYITQAAADLLYYPLTSNPAGYITSAALTGYVPTTRTLTINGTTYDLSADRSWTIAAGGTVTSVELAAGTGISLSGTNPITTSGTITVTNDAPDQIVSLGTTGTGLSVTGTYPSFTLENTGLVSVPDLQQVTDVGATTTNTIVIDNGSGTNTSIADYQIDVADSTNRVRIGTDYVAIRSNGLYDAIFASTNLTAGILTLEVPDKTGTYTIATTDQLGLQNAITIDPVLTASNTIDGGNFSLQFNNVYKFEVVAEQRASFQANNGTDSANMYASPIDGATYLDYIKGGTQQTFISLLGDQLRVGTPDVLTKSVGDVLTLVDPASGEVEFQTPTGGGSGIPYGVASGTNTYTVSISGAAYVAGNAYIISFTNGNDDDSTININGLGAKLLVKEFDIQLTGGDIVSGQDLIIIYDGTNFQTLGVAPNQLFAYVTNDDSVTITKGQPVYAFGAAGNRMSVKLAYNTSDATSAQTVGLVFSSSIAPNQRGFIITQGVISGLNTAAYSSGAQLYLGPTAGSLTATKPHAPNHLVYIGIVERSNAGNGQIYVKPQNGYELDELHDVDLITTPPVNNDVLVFDTSTTPDLWVAKSIPTILGYTPANIASPAFTGNPTAPTPASGDNDTSIATTAFVTNAVQQSLSFVGYFGAGTDGNVTISGAVTLTRDMFYNDLTIAAGGSLYLAGYRIFVKGSLDLTNAGANGIHNNGYAGGNNVSSVSGALNAGGTVGRGGYGATVYGWFNGGTAAAKNKGGFGGNGGSGVSVNGANAAAVTVLLATEGFIGGPGGSSGAGGNSSSGATGGLGITGQASGITVAGYTTSTPQTFIVNPSVEHTLFSRIRQDTASSSGGYTTYIYYGAGHGSGGGGGASTASSVAGMGGGAGGGGGGTVVIFARNIIVGTSTDAQAISAKGGNGGTGGSQPTFNGTGGGGAGGGGGGFVYLVVGSISGTTGVTFVSANGGTGGNGGDGRGAGNFGGQGGSGGYGGKITVTNLSTNSLTVTNSTTTAASAATIPVGISGTAGTTGVTCTYSS